MSRQRRKLPNVVLYWVVVWSLTTGDILNYKSFVEMKDARLHKMDLEEAPDPEGRVCQVTIETLLAHELPK